MDSSGTTANGPLGGDQVDRALVSELVGALHGWDGNLFAGANIKPSERREGGGVSIAAFPRGPLTGAVVLWAREGQH